MKEKRRKQIRSIHRDGIVMTEVVIAFLLLTIIFSILYHCIRFSSHLMMQAADLGKENEYFEEGLGDAFKRTETVQEPYKGGAGASAVNITFQEKGGVGSYVLSAKAALADVSYYEADHTTARTQKLYYYTY